MKVKEILIAGIIAAVCPLTSFSQAKEMVVSREELPEYTSQDSGAVTITVNDTGFRPNLEGLKVEKNVEYVDRDGVKLHLIIVSPEHPVDAPCIVYVQGSAWRRQSFFPPNMGEYARRGYVVAIVEYRHSGIAPFPAQVQDCKTAIRYMRKNAKRYGIDPDNIYLLGDSSGGHTALLAATTHGIKSLDTDTYGEYSDKVNAVAAFFPPTDLYAMTEYPSTMDHDMASSPEGSEIGGYDVTANREKAWWASPIAYLTGASVPPMFLAVGSMDELVPANQSDRYAQRLNQIGAEYEFYNIKGAAHGTWEFWTPQVTSLVVDFFKRH